MRYEAKHKYLKGLAVTMGNFINVPYSLSLRHQCLQAYISATGSCMEENVVSVGKGTWYCDYYNYYYSSEQFHH